MTPAEQRWRWVVQRSMERRIKEREEQQPINLTVVVKHEDERPRETARVRHVLPSPG